MIGWGPLCWWARTVSNRRHLLCKFDQSIGTSASRPRPSDTSYAGSCQDGSLRAPMLPSVAAVTFVPTEREGLRATPPVNRNLSSPGRDRCPLAHSAPEADRRHDGLPAHGGWRVRLGLSGHR
jgi:hypothetical protein